MRKYIAPTVAAFLLFAAAATGTTYTNPTTGTQSPGEVPEASPGVPYSATNPMPTTLIAGGASASVPVVSSATESSHALKGSAGSLSQLTVSIGATSGWVLVIDEAAVGANGAVAPKWWWPITSNGTNGAMAVTFNPALSFGNGIVAAFSTTGPFTQTLSATAAFSGTVQ